MVSPARNPRPGRSREKPAAADRKRDSRAGQEQGPARKLQDDLRRRDASRELTVVVPTFNERDNIRPLVAALDKALAGVAWEVIFVDDNSPDRTADLVREMALDDPRIRCLQRIGRRGLSSACVEGMYASAAPFLAVMDADLQHDERLLPDMLGMLRGGEADIVIGSRYVEGGGTGDWQHGRVRLANFARRVGCMVTRAPLRDPMSGFFMLKRPLIDQTVGRMSNRGFKILLDIFMSAKAPPRFRELPYAMRRRERGSSKLDLPVAWELFASIADKLIGRFIPVRFVMFVAVGGVGSLLHLALLGTFLQLLGQSFVVGQAVATVSAMTLNFLLNNLFTYRDRRIRGWRILRGLASFYLACGVGALINVVLAGYLYEGGIAWWLAGLLGAVVGAVWNFAVTTSFTWKRDEARAVTAKTTAKQASGDAAGDGT